MALAERPINLFDNKNIRDYNKQATLSSLRANCARAVELDDKTGAKKNNTYLLAMAGVADAIYAELGMKPKGKGKAAPVVEPVDIKESEDYKKLEVLLTAAQERSVEQEEELETMDKELEDMAAKIKTLEAKATPAKKTAAKKKGAK